MSEHDTPAEPTPPESTPSGESAPAAEGTLEERVIEALKTVYDPEIPLNIYELGLIYEVKIEENDHVHVLMTLTSPSCPVAGTLPGEVETKVKEVEGVADAYVELVWDPPWSMAQLSEEAKLQLGLT
ncbi:MAG: SUF system Fe-S cluster assembly protein [Planctomycetota bacterium]|nr:SUF system Fe-S cluster assembly protein [Planctomycetota bacterium]